MNPLPSSSKTVLKILGTEGAMTHKDIVSKSHCSPRTIRYALRKLKEKKLLIEKMNMRDMRQIIYQVPGDSSAGERGSTELSRMAVTGYPSCRWLYEGYYREE